MAAAAIETDQHRRRADYVEVQKILAEDLPGIPLWYPNNQVIHTRRVEGVRPDASGTFDFLRKAWIQISSH
jgi:peptide/nickel transport system substrate-binding protein